MLDANETNTEMNMLIAEKSFTGMITRAEEIIENYPDKYLGY